MSKYPRLIAKLAREYGAELVKLNNGHFEIANGHWRITASSTPTCVEHALLQIQRDIRRANHF